MYFIKVCVEEGGRVNAMEKTEVIWMTQDFTVHLGWSWGTRVQEWCSSGRYVLVIGLESS